MAKKILPTLARLHRLQGQLEGVERMMTRDERIEKILQQLEAVRGSIVGLEHELLKEKIKRGASDELKDALRYLLQ